MNLNDIYKTLKNEYLLGKFELKEDHIIWTYSSDGVDSYEEAENRFLAYLGAKETALTILGSESNNNMYDITDAFEEKYKIGLIIK